ncbi:TIGR03086 family metal-binding protein [Nocardioides litoris]|uniref:TIGR03086 family metal-binding protein n=1 Tax=Nocardioides litoris TaxID=1926648 RepID=UPI001476DBD5|nr:TIGR03086 family metal-binding protein [Nocardioides litoris]
MTVLHAAQDGVGALLRRLSTAHWSLPTPCDGMDVAALARHLVVGERAFVRALGGETYDLEALTAEAEPLTTADLPGAWAGACAALRAAYDACPPDRFVPTPLGDLPRDGVAGVRTLEAVGHGWDLSRATGLPVRLGTADDLAALVPVADRLRVALDAARPGSDAYGTPYVVGPDASALDQVAARLGRDPGWEPPA